jgi:hypothetical protein
MSVHTPCITKCVLTAWTRIAHSECHMKVLHMMIQCLPCRKSSIACNQIWVKWKPGFDLQDWQFLLRIINTDSHTWYWDFSLLTLCFIRQIYPKTSFKTWTHSSVFFLVPNMYACIPNKTQSKAKFLVTVGLHYIEIVVFWDVVGDAQCFGRTWCLHLLLPWRWRQQFSLRCWCPSTRLYGVTFQKTAISVFIIRTSDLTQWYLWGGCSMSVNLNLLQLVLHQSFKKKRAVPPHWKQSFWLSKKFAIMYILVLY